jgi:ABC-type transporter Mla MlaB component
MAKNNQKPTFGYDPLAWMNQSENASEENQKSAPELAAEESAVTRVSILDPILEEETNPVETGIEAVSDAAGSVPELEDESKIILDQVHNLPNIASLRQKMLNAFENTAGTITIDASAVTSIDTASMQLFLALHQEAKRADRQVSIDFPSDKFLEAAGLLGVSNALGVDKLAAGLF